MGLLGWTSLRHREYQVGALPTFRTIYGLVVIMAAQYDGIV